MQRGDTNWLYQFHSSSLWSFVFTDGVRLLVELEEPLESGTITLPRPCASLSSSKSECVLAEDAIIGGGVEAEGDVERGESVAANGLEETDTDVPDEGPGEARAEKNVCDTSERIIDARF